MTNLAELYRAQERYAEARPLYEKALAVAEKTIGAESPAVAMNLNNQALLHMAENRPRDAERLLQKALSIQEKGLRAGLVRLVYDAPESGNGLPGPGARIGMQSRYGHA